MCIDALLFFFFSLLMDVVYFRCVWLFFFFLFRLKSNKNKNKQENDSKKINDFIRMKRSVLVQEFSHQQNGIMNDR